MEKIGTSKWLKITWKDYTLGTKVIACWRLWPHRLGRSFLSTSASQPINKAKTGERSKDVVFRSVLSKFTCCLFISSKVMSCMWIFFSVWPFSVPEISLRIAQGRKAGFVRCIPPRTYLFLQDGVGWIMSSCCFLLHLIRVAKTCQPWQPVGAICRTPTEGPT